ncbi:MAG TPA: type II 3-dehydroquinate dehydratase, partial [Verrucomicrobiae bacterium]|nr:type II 3-dehydroquinate dehydratase [Verrucomicrobiae bacterium]
REPKLYGQTSLAQIETDLIAEAGRLGHRLQTYQSNHEGELVDRVHRAKTDNVAYVLLNPGAYTHTSVALRDALLAVALPFIEIHLSNTHARETFRRQSFFSDIARGVIVGLGPLGYRLALQAAHAQLATTH